MTLTNIDNLVFPREADLAGLIQDGHFSAIRERLQAEGIFLSCQKEELPRLLSRYLLSESFYREIFNLVHRKEHGLGITGVRFKKDDLTGIYDLIHDERNKPLRKNRYNARFVSIGEVSDGVFEVGMQYDVINPKFVAFNRRDTFDVKARIEMVGEDVIEVSGKQLYNTDAIVLRDLANHLIKELKSEPLALNITTLPTTSRVDLFDKIIRDHTKKQWRIEKCCGLSVRSGDAKVGERSLSRSETNILHSAVLDGENLRDHRIVTDLVAQGYFFSSATLWTYSNSNPRYIIRVKIDFKQNADIVVVNADYARVLDKDDNEERKLVDVAVGEECIRYYWDQIHDLYKKALEAEERAAKRVVRDEAPVVAAAS